MGQYLELHGDGNEQPVLLSPRTAIIVPTGTWHRLNVHEPSEFVAVTPRRDTRHEKDLP